MADKIIRMGMGLLVGVWVARYLAPQAFGALNFAMAFVSFVTPLASLGMEAIVVRELVKNAGSSAGKVLASAWLLRFLAGFIAMGLAVVFIMLIRPGEVSSQILVIIISSSILFQSTEVLDLWFQSEVRSQFAVVPRIIATLVASAIKVGMILYGCSVRAFAVATVVEIALVAAGLTISFFIFRPASMRLKPTLKIMKSLLRDGWPLILTGFMIIIYMRTDQIMLGQMRGDAEVGVYSAAIRIAEIWYFIPMSVAASVFPFLLNIKQKSETIYYSRLQSLYAAMTWMGILFAAFISFFSPLIVRLLYGADYSAAAPVLTISAWAGVFVAQGVARGKWMVIENLQRYTMWYIGGAAVINVALNFMLIPRFGSQGAAYATLVAQCSASLVIPALIAPTRPSVVMLLASFKPSAAVAGFQLLSNSLMGKAK